MCAFRRAGPPKVKVVSKIRRTKAQAYTDDWNAISRQTIKDGGGVCSECGRPSSQNNRLRAHHVISVSRGGKTIPYMLKVLCDYCHARKPGHKHLRK